MENKINIGDIVPWTLGCEVINIFYKDNMKYILLKAPDGQEFAIKEKDLNHVYKQNSYSYF